MDPVDLPDRIYLAEWQWKAMREAVEAAAPEEACGLIAGRQEIASEIIPVENILHSRTRFSMNPEQVVKAFQAIEARNLILLAIYHSHPIGPAFPSATDIAEANYPSALQLIWGRNNATWTCSAYQILNGSSLEVPILGLGNVDT